MVLFVLPKALSNPISFVFSKVKKIREEAILKIRANSEIEKIKLIADPVQQPTISLYQKLGFKKIALIKKELKYKGKYCDDLHMEKWLEDDSGYISTDSPPSK